MYIYILCIIGLITILKVGIKFLLGKLTGYI